MNLEKMAEKYRDAGYSERNADARVCQDIVLKAIARSNLGRNVTIKGGTFTSENGYGLEEVSTAKVGTNKASYANITVQNTPTFTGSKGSTYSENNKLEQV